jgi:hypothetical protein
MTNDLAEKTREVLGGLRDPFGGRQRVGAEGLEVALLSVLENRPIQPQVAGLPGINQRRRIIGAHSGRGR